jgi:hypothetical protein
MCVSAPERDSSTNRTQSIEIAHKKRFTASLPGSRSRAYRTPLSRAFYCYVNVLDGIFLRMIVGRPAVGTSIFRPLSRPWTQPERPVPWRRVKASIRARHRGIVPNVAPRKS